MGEEKQPKSDKFVSLQAPKYSNKASHIAYFVVNDDYIEELSSEEEKDET